MNTLVADSVVKMIEARLQPAYLPRAVADGLAALNAEQRGKRVYPMTDVWGRW